MNGGDYIKKSEYINLSSEELKLLIEKKKKELDALEDYCFDVELAEYRQKYITVKIEGCKGCKLEYTEWNNYCDHCDGYHYEDKLRQ